MREEDGEGRKTISKKMTVEHSPWATEGAPTAPQSNEWQKQSKNHPKHTTTKTRTPKSEFHVNRIFLLSHRGNPHLEFFTLRYFTSVYSSKIRIMLIFNLMYEDYFCLKS